MAFIEVVLCDYSNVLNKNIFNTGKVSWKQCHAHGFLCKTSCTRVGHFVALECFQFLLVFLDDTE